MLNMRRFAGWLAALSAAGALCCSPVWAQSDEDDDDDEDVGVESVAPAASGPQFPWPSQFSADGQSFTVYPPELDRWEGNQLQGRAAVSVQSSGSDTKPLYGVAELTARVQVDATTQVATLSEMRVARINFPTAAQDAPRYREIVQSHLAAVTWQLPADQLRGELAVDRAAHAAHSQPVRNEAPAVIFSDRSAILVPIDGPPVLREMVGLGLKRVLNTRALILQDPESDRYFIYVAGRWMESRTLDGPWTDAQIRPSALDDAKQQVQASGQVDLLDADNQARGTTRIFVTTTPTELVQTEGPPQYSPVSGTQLLYVTNTPNRLFLDLRTQQYYVLLSGRWFRTRALDQARWEYVAGSALPADFTAIPDGHPTATVRESVPGTPQADEAAIANSVPQVATVRRTEARLDLTYDGAPQFKPIEGTSLDYAVNSPVPVIRIDDRDYYALDNGVWFFSATVDGPWSPASFVPPVIYTIPRSSPLHYVTYVRVYGATSDTLSVGYTPGYVGSYVTTDNTVVYGSGYYYRPWVGSVWYGYPVTWGFGFSYWNTWWHPWRGPRWAFRPVPVYRPWWGPWHRPFVGHRHFVGAPAVRVAPAGRPVVVNQVNVTNIYQRWGRNVATRHPASAVPVVRARAQAPGPAPGNGVQPDGSVYRRRDGQSQRFRGNGQWENSQPPANASQPAARLDPSGNARAVPVTPAPAAGTPPVITVPRHDRRRAQADANDNASSGARPIVGSPPSMQNAPEPSGVVRNPPGSTVRPIVGPTPGIETRQPSVGPQQSMPRPIVGPPPGIPNPGVDSAATDRHDGRHSQSDRGRNAVVVPVQPATTPPPVRQRFEQRGNFSTPHAVPVPPPAAVHRVPEAGMSHSPAARAATPAVIAAPPVSGRNANAGGGKGGDERGSHRGGHGGPRESGSR